MSDTFLVIDGETTTSNKGNPFDSTNKLCCIGYQLGTDDKATVVEVEHQSGRPYGAGLSSLKSLVESCSPIVGFNVKFDLHWLRRYGVTGWQRVWDCQIYEFLKSNQKWVMPSLQGVLEKRGLPGKLSTIAEDYWDKNIDTLLIPWNDLSAYCANDVEITKALYLEQMKEFAELPVNRQNLIKAEMMDLIVLQEMEYNGMAFDSFKSVQDGDKCAKAMETLDYALRSYVDIPDFNFSSGDHLSAFLYGGTIRFDVRVPNGVYKSGAKVGQPRYRIEEKVYTLPRLVEPIKGTELKKEGYWSTDEPTLRKLLKRASKVDSVAIFIEHLLARAELEKKVSTYLHGFPSLIAKMNWPINMIHGAINQTTVITGRTSSSKPNLQNIDSGLKYLFPSRYTDDC